MAASDARFMHDMMAKMLRYPVYLDSANLVDLRQLISNGVADSDVVLVLGTQGIFTRPWCLIECAHATRIGTPVRIIEITNSGFDPAAVAGAHARRRNREHDGPRQPRRP